MAFAHIFGVHGCADPPATARGCTTGALPRRARALHTAPAVVDIFMLGGPTGALIAAAIALVPAIVAYVRGRQIARFADDPALPERLFAGRRVTSRTLVFTIAILFVTGRSALWAIPFTLIAYWAAGLPARRILFGETWGLPAYLSFVIRFFIALWSFWPLVCALPALAVWAGERAWIVAAGLGSALMLLAARQTDAIRWTLRTRPIEDEAIRARFDRLAAACGLPAPRFEMIDLKGGSMANAFALPSLGRSTVLFTGPLLQRLDADEADAICAHELAHLEYYNSRRLRQRRLISRALVAGGALLTPLLRLLHPPAAWLLCVVWPIGVLFAVAALVRDRQRHETASDLRAIALTGNPEALVRGLVKVHAISRVPRRWDAELERHMTHPSLKRRIQDIRAAAGTPPAALGDSAAFDSPDGATRVVFGIDSLEWIEGTSASYRLRYDRLRELRVAATRTGETSLLAADRGGHRWQMRLRIDDVPRLQAVLDIVEARVGAGGSPPVSVLQPLLIRVATLTVFVVSINVGMIAAAMVLALTLVRPAAPLLGAAGFGALGAALLTWRDSGGSIVPDDFQATFRGVLLVAGAALLRLAWSRRREDVPARVTQLVAVVGAAALASWLLPVILGTGGVFDAVALYQAARDWPSSVVLPLAFAGALLWSPGKMRRAGAAAGVVASVTAAVVGSQAFLDRFGGDPFLVPAPEVSIRTLDRPVSEFTVPFGINGLELSPNGRSIAVVSRRANASTEMHIGRAGGTLTAVEGDGVSFVDDDRAVVWSTDGSRTELREVNVTAPVASRWHLEVTGLTAAPVLSLDAESQRWRLASAGVDAVEIREGVIGQAQIERHRWPVAAAHGAPIVPIAVAGDRAVAVEPRADLISPITNPLSGLMFAFGSTPRWRSTIWALGPDGAADLGTSRLELSCQPLAAGGACQLFDASRTRFFTMDAATRGFTAAVSLPGRFFAGTDAQANWITGWYRSALIAIRLTPAEAIRVAGPNGEHPHMLAASDHAAAGVWYRMPVVSGLRVDAMYQQTATCLVRIYAID